MREPLTLKFLTYHFRTETRRDEDDGLTRKLKSSVSSKISLISALSFAFSAAHVAMFRPFSPPVRRLVQYSQRRAAARGLEPFGHLGELDPPRRASKPKLAKKASSFVSRRCVAPLRATASWEAKALPRFGPSQPIEMEILRVHAPPPHRAASVDGDAKAPTHARGDNRVGASAGPVSQRGARTSGAPTENALPQT